MSPVAVEFNANGNRIVSRDGRLLCSPRNPLKEASDWVRKQKILSEDSRVLVLGVGAGYHLDSLRETYPHLRISIFDFDESIYALLPTEGIPYERVDVKKLEQAHSFDVVLAFRPAWQGLEKEYVDTFLFLTGRLHFSLKNLDFTEDSQAEDATKIWRCLRELVE